jgi:hypothetical protein
MAGKEPTAVPEPYRPIIRWTAKQLNPEHERLYRLAVIVSKLTAVRCCFATRRRETRMNASLD